jgi:hypothetical protein
MTSKNDVTGDLIKTKADCMNAYAEGWERIFAKKKEDEKKNQENTESDLKQVPYSEH